MPSAMEDDAPRLPRIGARRRRPEGREEAPRWRTELAAPSTGSRGGAAASLPRRTHRPALLLAALPAAAAALLLLAAAPCSRAFVPPVQHQHQHQHQPPQARQRHRPDATVGLAAEIFGASASQPPGGSSPPTPPAAWTSLASPPPAAVAAPAAGAAAAAAAAAGSSARRRSRLDQSLALEGAPHLEPASVAAAQLEQLQDRQQQQQQQRPPQQGDGIEGGPLAQMLTDELPGLCLASALEKAPLRRLLQPQAGVDAGACQRRLQALKAALPGGVNVTHAVLEAPRLLAYYGWDAAALEGAVGPRFRALCEATGTAADAAEIVNRWPRVLLRDFDARVKPHLEALAELLPGTDAAYLLRKHPAVLGKSVEAHLRPRVQRDLPALFPAAADALGSSSEQQEQQQQQDQHPAVGLGSLAVTYPELLTAPLEPLRERVAALTELLPPGLLLPTLSMHARAWTADLGEEVGPQVQLLRARLGEETARAVLLNLPSAMYHTPGALARRLDVLEALLGPDAHAVLALNPMILAVDAAAHVAPKVRYLRALFDPELVDDARFHAMLATEAGAKCLTSAFGRLGRLSYLLQVQPSLDLAAGLLLCVTSSEELRRRYPGYENFLEDRIEPRFPNYTWEQLCALPFAMREQAHGEILHTLYSLPAGEGGGNGEEGEGDGVGGGFFEPIDPLALLDDEPAGVEEDEGGAR